MERERVKQVLERHARHYGEESRAWESLAHEFFEFNEVDLHQGCLDHWMGAAVLVATVREIARELGLSWEILPASVGETEVFDA